MAKLENNLKNMFLSLTVISVVVGGLLGLVASITDQPIKDAAAKAQEEAIKAVAPEFDAVTEPVEVTSANGEPAVIFDVTKGGQKVGCAVKAITKKGFGGRCVVMVGFDLEGNITGYNVLDCSNETPGLGAKMPDWFQTNQGERETTVIGKNPGTNNLIVSKDNNEKGKGEIDAITAATISSRAFLDAVAQAYGVISGNADATSSATAQVAEEAAAQCGECADACQGCSGEGECNKPEEEKCEKCKAAAAANK